MQGSRVLYDIKVAGSKDNTGEVPDRLIIFGAGSTGSTGNIPIKLILDQPMEVKLNESNYAGQSTAFELHYQPIARSKRHIPVTETVVHSKDNALNIFSVNFPLMPENGHLIAINGLSDDAYLLKPSGGLPFQCIDPAATIRLPAFGNLFDADLLALFGTLHPNFPIQIKACALGPSSNKNQVNIQLTYPYN